MVRVLCCKSQGPQFNHWVRLLCYILHMFLMCMTYGIVWYTQVQLFLVISVLTRKFRYLTNKIKLAVVQKGEEGESKRENI